MSLARYALTLHLLFLEFTFFRVSTGAMVQSCAHLPYPLQISIGFPELHRQASSVVQGHQVCRLEVLGNKTLGHLHSVKWCCMLGLCWLIHSACSLS